MRPRPDSLSPLEIVRRLTRSPPVKAAYIVSGRGSKLHRALDRGRGRGCGGKSSKGMAIGAGAVASWGELGRLSATT